MRIVASVPLYPPHSRVGAWLATHEYLRHMVARGHDVTVCPYMSRDSNTIDGVKVTRGSKFPELLPGADVVVSHCGDNSKAHRMAVKAKVPSVRMFHGGRFIPDTVSGAALVVYNSESSRQGRHGIVCRPLVNPDEYRVAPGSAVTLVNLSKAKGVRTFSHCAAALPDIEFIGVVGGTGIQEKPRRVEIIPHTDDMRAVYSRTRVVLMPSDRETWGRVGMEAMCSGIPVIAHPTAGLEESLGSAGIFVHRTNFDGWAAEIKRLMDADEYAAASERALARIAELDYHGELNKFAEAVEALA